MARAPKAKPSTRFHGTISADTAQALKELRGRIESSHIAPSELDVSVNIATWNIREFGKKARTETALHLIAEIVSEFDLVAVVELRDNLEDMHRVIGILGTDWRLVYSDVIDDSAGNSERIAFLYDSRAVHFTGLAAEANPIRKKSKAAGASGGAWHEQETWWRSPYMASFRAGRFDFVIMAVHIRWGSSETERLTELEMLAEWMDTRRKSKFVEDRDFIVVGDFNIPSRKSKLFQAITNYDLKLAPGLAEEEWKTNVLQSYSYDQILHHTLEPALYVTKKGGQYTTPAGVLNFAKGGLKALFPNTKLSDGQLTFQLSDHLPLWMQLQVWSDDLQLDQILNQ